MRTLILSAVLGLVPLTAAPANNHTMSTVEPPASSSAACAPATADTAADFFNRALPGQLAQHKVPGAVVSVVSGDSTVFSHGYGLADAEDRVPFDADRSLVRIASITKLFTWTAVMQ